MNKGKQGEQIACEFLLKNEFKILKRNYRYKKYEIDIIAYKNNIIHIIEVKFHKYIDMINLKHKYQYLQNIILAKFDNCFISIDIIFIDNDLNITFLENIN